MQLRLMTDYECHPIWEELADGERNLAPQDLPISPELVSRLIQWQLDYDRTLDRQDPARSGFKSREQEEAFEREGRAIWIELRQQLGPEYDVTFFSQIENRELQRPDS